MSTNISEIFVQEINELAALAERLAHDASASSSGLGANRIAELGTIAARGGQLIRRLYGPGSQYEHNLKRVMQDKYFTMMHSDYFSHIAELAGIIAGVQRDVHSGLLRDIRRLLQAEVFADFLDMAEHLLGEGYKDAAAVLLGAVMEDSLRKLSDANNLPVTSQHGKPLTIDPLNVALTKTGVYGPLVQKQVTTWANLRNDAAHGHFEKYDSQQVRQMLLFVQKFCADYMQ
jgi:hypothetical protein